MRTAIVFAVDKGFLRGLHVLLWSLTRSPRLNRLDKIVMTTNKEVAEDKVVRAACEVRFINRSELEPLTKVKSSKFKPQRTAELPKYSMLKWFVFEDYGYERHLYLDADIINLSDADELLDLHAHIDFAYAPRFPVELRLGSDKSPLPKHVVSENVKQFCTGKHTFPRALNSGVMLLGKRMMDSAVREGLTQKAVSNPYPSDQDVLRAWLRAQKGLSTYELSPFFNFNANFFKGMSEDSHPDFLKKIKFFHYVGAKPWSGVYTHFRLWAELEAESRLATQNLGNALAM